MKEKDIYIDNDFVGIAAFGEVGPAKAITLAREYINLACQYPQHNILVDLRGIKASIDLLNLMKITLEVSGSIPVLHKKVAHLTCDECERIRIAKQLESCMILKGFTYKVFTDFNDATDWLSKAS